MKNYELNRKMKHNYIMKKILKHNYPAIENDSYKVRIGELIERAIDWQNYASEVAMSYGELGYFQSYFETRGRMFGLLEEFHENGIC